MGRRLGGLQVRLPIKRPFLAQAYLAVVPLQFPCQGRRKKDVRQLRIMLPVQYYKVRRIELFLGDDLLDLHHRHRRHMMRMVERHVIGGDREF